MALFPKIIEGLRGKGADNVLVFGGGIIPADDIPTLTDMGMAAIFTPGTTTQSIVEWLNGALQGAA